MLSQSVAGGIVLQSGEGILAVLSGMFAFVLLLSLVILAAMWKVFTKAGQPGWAAIIPIYNVYVLLQIVGRPGWWLLLLFVPLVNLVVSIVVAIDLAKSFGKGIGFAVGMLFLPIIFYPILGFGEAQYQGAPN